MGDTGKTSRRVLSSSRSWNSAPMQPFPWASPRAADLRPGGAGHACSPSAAQGLSRGSSAPTSPGGILRPLWVFPSLPPHSPGGSEADQGHKASTVAAGVLSVRCTPSPREFPPHVPSPSSAAAPHLAHTCAEPKAHPVGTWCFMSKAGAHALESQQPPSSSWRPEAVMPDDPFSDTQKAK